MHPSLGFKDNEGASGLISNTFILVVSRLRQPNIILPTVAPITTVASPPGIAVVIATGASRIEATVAPIVTITPASATTSSLPTTVTSGKPAISIAAAGGDDEKSSTTMKGDTNHLTVDHDNVMRLESVYSQ
jgi:hypothetical protein